MSYLTHGRNWPRRSVMVAGFLTAILVVLGPPALIVYGAWLLVGWLT